MGKMSIEVSLALWSNSSSVMRGQPWQGHSTAIFSESHPVASCRGPGRLHAVEAVEAGPENPAQLHHAPNRQSAIGLHYFLDHPVDRGFPVTACRHPLLPRSATSNPSRNRSPAIAGKSYVPARRSGLPVNVASRCPKRVCLALAATHAANNPACSASLPAPKYLADEPSVP